MQNSAFFCIHDWRVLFMPSLPTEPLSIYSKLVLQGSSQRLSIVPGRGSFDLFGAGKNESGTVNEDTKNWRGGRDGTGQRCIISRRDGTVKLNGAYFHVGRGRYSTTDRLL